MGKDAPSLRDVRNPRARHLMRRQADQALAFGGRSLPPRAGMSPEIARRMLVLPAPLAPSSTNTVPSSTANETSRTAKQVAVGHAEIVHREKRHRSALCLVPR